MHGKEMWPFLFLLGILAFCWPLPDLIRIPLPYYLYTAWAVFILMIGILVSVRSRGGKG